MTTKRFGGWMAGALAMAIVGAWGPSVMALPSIDDLLGAAREGHPDMLAAKAKVAAVQAELSSGQPATGVQPEASTETRESMSFCTAATSSFESGLPLKYLYATTR